VIVHVLRKPLVGTVAANALQHGCGALNIDECRVSLSPDEDPDKLSARSGGLRGFAEDGYVGGAVRDLPAGWDCSKGRWPANLVHDGSDEAVGLFPLTVGVSSGERRKGNRIVYGNGLNQPVFGQEVGYGDSGSTARYFQQVEIK
jgi:site-specific DNA-methyltransferase (adenine-specific)